MGTGMTTTPKWQAERRERLLRKEYKIGCSDYEAMFVAQDGRCAICCRPETRRNRRGAVQWLSVDHDHATGKVRGLLCASCNLMIGYAGDSATRLYSGAEYVKAHNRAGREMSARPAFNPFATPGT